MPFLNKFFPLLQNRELYSFLRLFLWRFINIPSALKHNMLFLHVRIFKYFILKVAQNNFFLITRMYLIRQ